MVADSRQGVFIYVSVVINSPSKIRGGQGGVDKPLPEYAVLTSHSRSMQGCKVRR